MSIKHYKCPRCGNINACREASRWKSCSRATGCGSTLSARHQVE